VGAHDTHNHPQKPQRHQIAANTPIVRPMMNRPITRRQFVQALAFTAAIPSSFAQDAYAGQYLSASKTKTKLLDGEAPYTDHWQFKTASGHPVIHARQGQELHLRLFNEVDETLWLHFFGLRGPTDMTTVQVAPGVGNSVEVVFTPPDAGTFWFGPLISASKQRDMGLAGMLIVDEATPQNLNDIPMIFDDWSLTENAAINPDFTNLNTAAGEGRIGNWFTVNGQFKPRIALDPAKPARLRMLNVANARTMKLALKGAEGHIIARDGQPTWPTPLGLEPLTLCPGQRVDLLLTEAQDQVVIALETFEDVVEVAFLETTNYGLKPLPTHFQLPANPWALPTSTATPRKLNFAIEGGLKGGLKSAKVNKDVLDLRAMLEQGLAWSLGGNAGLGSPPLFEAALGAVLHITFDNRTAYDQPLHIHGQVWSQLPNQSPATIGPPPPPVWSDTLVIPAKSSRTVQCVASNPGTWAIQSLVAERSDAGLIASFLVSDMP
jgi:FtsP/CotA-like multicopper oxidase with cupredoxin domain